MPAMAACPPAGHGKSDLQALRAAGFTMPDAARRQALALELVDCLASPDPELRDGIAFEALSTWMRAGDFDAARLRALRDDLYLQLQAPDPQGVLHPFAALVLSEVARTDRVAPWMDGDERAAMLSRATGYLRSVDDYRGFEPGIGWRHGVAHGADWLLQLVLNPALDRVQLQQVLDAVAVQALPRAGHAYVFGEPERLARPLTYAARRDLVAGADWQVWLDGLLARLGSMPAVGDAAWLARRHDLRALLSDMYIEADQTRNPALARLKPLLAKTLAAMP
jgi:hypothetical protein